MADIQVEIEGIIRDGEIWVSAKTLLNAAWSMAVEGGEFDAVEVIAEIVAQAALAAEAKRNG